MFISWYFLDLTKIYDNNQKFYLARVYDNRFQYSKGGSFYIGSSGNGSFSGGYDFDAVQNDSKIGSFESSELEEVKCQNESRQFWFFMDFSSGAHRAVYCDLKVRVWKFKNNSLCTQ